MITIAPAALVCLTAFAAANPVPQSNPTASYDVLVNFDDLPNGAIQNPYQHLTWSSLSVGAYNEALSPVSPPNNAVSEVSVSDSDPHTILSIGGTETTSFDLNSFSAALVAPVGRGGRDVAVSGKFFLSALTTGGFGHTDGYESYTASGPQGSALQTYGSFKYVTSVSVIVASSDAPLNQTRIVFDQVQYTAREGETF